MGDHITVRMTGKPAGRLDHDPAENERNALGERVRVHAQPDAELAHPSGSCRRSRSSKTVTVS